MSERTEPTISADKLTVRIFADGADLPGIRKLADTPGISGFTTNPTLMRAAGVTDYEAFGREVLEAVGHRPISFEVFADDEPAMERQALKLASWGANVFVKIPVTTTDGVSTAPLVSRLAGQGVQLNVTALLTLDQVETVVAALAGSPPAFVSVFAGRVADTGRDPVPIMQAALEVLAPQPQLALIWASPREILNIVQADEIGCHVITVTHDLLAKLPTLGRDLTDFSLATVKMFHDDAKASGFAI
jgi:transaldolase